MSDFNYFFEEQLKSYIVQFAAVFAGMNVSVGKSEDQEMRLIRVPVKSASTDRVVAWLSSDATQNLPIRLPLMTVNLASIELAPDLRKGVGNTRRSTYVPMGGILPDDVTVIEQRMPVPYRATFELSMWVSNTLQHHQILEQILVLFDPILQIQKNDEPFDWTKLTTLELVGVRFDENLPPGTDDRIIQSTLEFTVPIYLTIPAEAHKRVVQQIFLRVGAVGANLANSYDVIADLDSQGIQYEQVFSAADDIGTI